MDFAGFWGGGVSTILIGLSTILLGRSTILIGLSTVCPWFVHGQFGFQFFFQKKSMTPVFFFQVIKELVKVVSNHTATATTNIN